MKWIALICAATLCVSASAYAQPADDMDDGGAPPPGAGGPPPGVPGGPEGGPGGGAGAPGKPGGRAMVGKRKDCFEAAQAKGLRGPDRGDSMVICMAEARLECLKKAVADKARGPKRKEYVQNCMGS